ncbi:MAG: DNA cytosine methyltransferase [Anaerolineae bacterium]|nr:DNA cytosine methyltransferase [Anaerolineae bacterium]
MNQLILSLFPGADLFGRAFEERGFCIVRGPDRLWAQDVRDFHAIPGKFDGIIGGPPCQPFSAAAISGSDAENLIPEFVRIIEESRPQWAVMENVMGAAGAAPPWPSTTIRDWDVGGNTFRKRTFWFYGIDPAPKPILRAGEPNYSVLASSWNRHGQLVGRGPNKPLSAEKAAALQGFPNLGEQLIEGLPGKLQGDGVKWRGVSLSSRNILAVHMLGNGVPRAMGLYIARHVENQLEGRSSIELTGLPLFSSMGV